MAADTAVINDIGPDPPIESNRLARERPAEATAEEDEVDSVVELTVVLLKHMPIVHSFNSELCA